MTNRVFRLFTAVVAALAAAGAVCAAPGAPDPATSVLALLDRVRAEAGLPRFERPAALDASAARRARDLAALPAAQLGEAAPTAPFLDAAGVVYAEAREHRLVAWRRDVPAERIVEPWRGSPAEWAAVMAKKYREVGAGWAERRDGRIVVVVLLVAPPPRRDAEELRALERSTFDGVNAERAARGLEPLRWNGLLAAIARRHGADMAARRYFDHRSPEGTTPAQRVEAAGLDFRAVGENLAESLGQDDPAANAVRGWMNSPEHRDNILDRTFEESGLGVAVGPRGELYFTQLFYTAPKRRGPPRR